MSVFPEIQHLGQACFTVSYAGVRVVTDPWFYPAYLASSFPWPDNRHLASEARGDYLYLSHHHEDHFDRRFLAGIDKDMPVIVARFRTRYLERELRKLGFRNLIVLRHGEQYRIAPGFTVTMLVDRSHKEDSALIMDMGSYRFLDSNDCELASCDWPNSVDLLACQFSGATWYPQCYDYPPDVMTAREAEVRASNLERMYHRVRLTGANSYLPSAGPMIFLDPALEHFNDRKGIFAWWEDVASEFSAEFPGVAVADSLPVTTSMEVYRELRRPEWEAWYSEPDTRATAEEVDAYFSRLQRGNSRFLGAYRKDICLNSGDDSWNVRLGRVSSQLEEAPEPSYWIKVPPRVLRALLDGRIAGWEEALTSHRCRMYRDPDKYDSTLMMLLQFGVRPAQTMAIVRQRDDAETIERDGLVMQRWCPHAGEDLSFASIRDGVIECPRHHWQWDAATGKCLAGDAALRVRQA